MNWMVDKGGKREGAEVWPAKRESLHEACPSMLVELGARDITSAKISFSSKMLSWSELFSTACGAARVVAS